MIDMFVTIKGCVHIPFKNYFQMCTQKPHCQRTQMSVGYYTPTNYHFTKEYQCQTLTVIRRDLVSNLGQQVTETEAQTKYDR